MNEAPEQVQVEQPADPSLPRVVQVLAGFALGGIVLLCLAGSLMMVFLPNEKAPIAAPIGGLVMSLAGFWVLVKCIRLIAGRKTHGGLITPRGLRLLGWFFLLLPIGGLFSGYFVTHTARALIQTAAYVGIFVGLRALASRRENNDA